MSRKGHLSPREAQVKTNVLNTGMLDEKQNASIERRRAMEEERKKRIFDVKQRTTGVDVKSLEEQIKEKKEREELEKKRNEAYDAQFVSMNRYLQEKDAEYQKARQDVEKDIVKFQKEEQRKEETREWYLNNPEYVKTIGQFDKSTLGPSSLQQFEGEDVGAKERTKEQKEQMKRWIEQQTREKEERRKAELELKKFDDYRQQEILERTKELQRLQEQTRRAMNMATVDYNKALHESKIQSEREELIDKTLMDLEEIERQINSDFLTENPSTQVSRENPNRVIPMQYKGMTSQQIEAIKEERERQVKEKEQKKKQDENEKKKWERQHVAIMRATLLKERELQRQRESLNRDMLEENKKLGQTHQLEMTHVNESAISKVSDDFYKQFGTSSR